MSVAASPIVVFDAVSKRFGAETALDAVSLAVHEGEFFALLGPSGCGKSTLLRLLAGFEAPDSGRVLLDGRSLAGVPAHKRPVNMMFQSYALFPHMTVAANVGFGLDMEGVAKPERLARTAEALALVKMEAFAARKPDQLSGGQRQRVALARALVKRPRVVLLDEPLGALDRRLREETQFELMAIRERLNLTFIVVTHDQDEAMTMASRIAVMDKGRIAQIGPPAEIYEEPANRHVAAFIGDVNMIEGVVREADGAGAQVETALAGLVPVAARHGLVAGERVTLAFRPEKARLVRGAEPIAGGRIVLAGTIAEIGYRGGETALTVAVAGVRLRATIANVVRMAERPFMTGEAVRLAVPPDALVVLKG